MQSFLPRILCADDDKSSLEMMGFWLGQRGYDVATVETLSEILRLAEQEAFDLYLLNDWFPDGRGRDFILQLRTLDPHTPIIFLSGDARAANREEIMRLGAQAFLAKPVDLDEVVATIAQVLCTAEQEQATFAPLPARAVFDASSEIA